MRNETPIAYGIDFGTSNSCVSVAYKSEVKSLGKLTSPGVPSLLYLDDIDQILVGDEAAEGFLLRGGFPSCRIMASLKSFLSHQSFTSTSSWGRTWDLPDLVGYIIRHLKNEADDLTGHDVRRVVLGHPVFFPGVDGEQYLELQELALERLYAAAERAGFDEIEFLDEPTAALTNDDIKRGITIALDFGGGTFDASVLDLTSPESHSVLSTGGIDIGGQQFDKVVFDKTLGEQLGLTSLPHFAQPLKYIGDMGETLMMGANNDVRSIIARLIADHPQGNLGPYGKLRRLFNHGHTYALSKTVEETKIRLSKDESTDLLFDRSADGIRLGGNITRLDFEAGISKKIEAIGSVIDETICNAGIDSFDINEIILTGGSCQIPLFRRLIQKKFPNIHIRETDFFGRVCSGLSYYGHKFWG